MGEAPDQGQFTDTGPIHGLCQADERPLLPAPVTALEAIEATAQTTLSADRWQPPRRYDTVFFAFWLSHVPPPRLPDFWNTVSAALAPGSKVIFIDDGPDAAAYRDVLTNQPTPAVVRPVG
ncbi:hypothetical protein SALBM311S_02895 [Streptomyces alboniger]